MPPSIAILLYRVKVASPRGESSNQLLETLEEWNATSNANASALPGTEIIIFERRWKISNEFPGIFSGYHVSDQIFAG